MQVNNYIVPKELSEYEKLREQRIQKLDSVKNFLGLVSSYFVTTVMTYKKL